MKKHCDLDLDKTDNDFSRNKTIDGEETGNKRNGDHDENRTQACHTMTMKECETSYRPQMTKVKVRVCPNGINLANESKEKMENR